MESNEQPKDFEQQMAVPEGNVHNQGAETEIPLDESPLTPRQIATEKYRQAHRNLDNATTANRDSGDSKSARRIQVAIESLKESGEELQKIIDAENKAKRQAAHKEKLGQNQGFLAKLVRLVRP